MIPRKRRIRKTGRTTDRYKQRSYPPIGQSRFIPSIRLSNFVPFSLIHLHILKKMDLESFVFHFRGRTCFQPVGERTSWHQVNGLSVVGYQSGAVVEVFLQRKLFKTWSILVSLVSSRFLKRMSGSLVLQDCELVTLMEHLWENTASGRDS